MENPASRSEDPHRVPSQIPSFQPQPAGMALRRFLWRHHPRPSYLEWNNFFGSKLVHFGAFLCIFSDAGLYRSQPDFALFVTRHRHF
jgi:hypothetical protein